MSLSTGTIGLVVLLVIQWPLTSEGRNFSGFEISKIFEAAVKAFPKEIEFPPETLLCRQVVEQGANITKYFLVEGSEKPDLEGLPAFVRHRDDKGKPWVYIPKAVDHLYYWETQTIVILRQSPKFPNLYSSLMVHFREIGPQNFVFEWDKWRPRGPYPLHVCPCTIVDKFYHPCEDWNYCKLVANVYQKAGDGSLSGANTTEHYTRRRRRFADDSASDVTETGNIIPKGSVAAFGPFFWDIVDTPLEASDTYLRIDKAHMDLRDKKTPAKYYNDNDNFPFSGYGDCPFEVKDGDLEQVLATKDQNKIVTFYLKTMRAQCLTPQKDTVQVIIDSKILIWNETKSCFVLNQTHNLRKKIGISDDELGQLELAIHFAAYTFVYPKIDALIKEEKQTNRTRDAITPRGFKIHRNTRMVVLMSLRIFDMIEGSANHHEVKLLRRLISSLKNHLMFGVHNLRAYKDRAWNDHEAYKKDPCVGEGNNDTCTIIGNIYKKDTFQAVALTFYILFGHDPTAPIAVRSLDTYAQFDQFYQFHIKFLKSYYSNYGFLEELGVQD